MNVNRTNRQTLTEERQQMRASRVRNAQRAERRQSTRSAVRNSLRGMA